MNELTNYLSEQEKILIANELDRLFALQDRPLNKEKKSALIDEIANTGIPAGPMLAGIRGLMAEDLKSIKFATIIDAARKLIVNVQEHREDCDFCGGVGSFPMKDENKYTYSLGCKCLNGSNLCDKEKLVQWNGEDRQFSNKRWLTPFFQLKYYKARA